MIIQRRQIKLILFKSAKKKRLIDILILQTKLLLDSVLWANSLTNEIFMLRYTSTKIIPCFHSVEIGDSCYLYIDGKGLVIGTLLQQYPTILL